MKVELHVHLWVHEVPNDDLVALMTQLRDQGEAIMDAVQDVFERVKAAQAKE